MTESPHLIRRRYIDVPFGQVHVAECGEPTNDRLPVVLLHQTPRSWDEYREILPLLGKAFRAIAVDTPGMGASDPAPGGSTIEAYAQGVLAALDAMGVARFHLVGHHTGGVIAVEIAAQDPERVGKVVLSSTPFIDADEREERRDRAAIDAVETVGDGSHLVELWQRRQAFYPEGRPDILERFVRDALRVHDAEAGHRAVGAYRMEARIERLGGLEILLIGHGADPHAFPHLDRLARVLPEARVHVVDDGMVPLELTADEFAAVVSQFLELG